MAQRLPDLVAAAVGDFASKVRARFGARVRELRLFGSYARGDWGPDSDVDVLVVVDGLDRHEYREILDLAFDVYDVTLLHLSPLALSTDEWRRHVDRELLIARDIERDGVAL